jgi:hypothetical protein
LEVTSILSRQGLNLDQSSENDSDTAGVFREHASDPLQ